MRSNLVTKNSCLLLILVISSAVFYSIGYACTRAVYLGPEGLIITGRSMDWQEPTGTDLWAFPRGMQRDGAGGDNSVKWKSKYGSVICSFYDVGSVDGMNDQGLVANVLYLTESDYGKPDPKRPNMSIAAWAQYVLDNFATVNETVAALRQESFGIIAPELPGGKRAAGHLAVSDTSGDSAIFEYVDGKLVIHHGKQFNVLTNSPTFDQQLALNKYWEQIGGNVFLPGTIRASDRFARASFYVNSIPRTTDNVKALASVFGVIRTVSVPLGIETPGQPNLASTHWRTVSDHKSMVYYFDSATNPDTFWVEMKNLDLKEGAEPKKLPLAKGELYSGDTAAQFKPAKPFSFLPAVLK